MRAKFLSGLIAASLVLTPALASRAQDARTIATAERLRDTAMEGTRAYAIVEELTTRFGPRPAGTPAEHLSAEWGADLMRSLGFQNVRIERFPLAVWHRGAERVEIVSPLPQPLVATALGGAVATPPEGIEAEAVLFETWQDLLDAPMGSLEGRIAVVLQDTIRAQDGRGYGSTSVMRFDGPRVAAERGAVGYVLRSLGTHDHRFAHTGATRYLDDPIPAFAISPPDADQLRRLARLDGGTPIRLRLFSSAWVEEGSHSQNVIGEIRGRERPEEVIVIGGHLDSWDMGTGALDDGAGLAITTAALELIARLPQRPRRTIRLVWWGAEEVSQPPPAQGLAGARFYAETYAAEAGNHVTISESDFGARRIYALSLPEGMGGTAFQRAAMRVLTPIGIVWNPAPARSGGPDTGPTVALGVPPFSLAQDGSDYFNYHHTADDVLDRIERDELDQNVAAWAALLWLIADSDVDFRNPVLID
ncbi:MAG: M20/M25/M40 family metallo-hydrolase [Brevundimonas sp.]|uniref:M20/M25/M40 family metallo-hydrolase n=1 Tax=Brevundimonas sp. TaxID=1871086 RepID=UPI00391B4F80